MDENNITTYCFNIANKIINNIITTPKYFHSSELNSSQDSDQDIRSYVSKIQKAQNSDHSSQNNSIFSTDNSTHEQHCNNYADEFSFDEDKQNEDKQYVQLLDLLSLFLNKFNNRKITYEYFKKKKNNHYILQGLCNKIGYKHKALDEMMRLSEASQLSEDNSYQNNSQIFNNSPYINKYSYQSENRSSAPMSMSNSITSESDEQFNDVQSNDDSFSFISRKTRIHPINKYFKNRKQFNKRKHLINKSDNRYIKFNNNQISNGSINNNNNNNNLNFSFAASDQGIQQTNDKHIAENNDTFQDNQIDELDYSAISGNIINDIINSYDFDNKIEIDDIKNHLECNNKINNNDNNYIIYDNNNKSINIYTIAGNNKIADNENNDNINSSFENQLNLNIYNLNNSNNSAFRFSFGNEDDCDTVSEIGNIEQLNEIANNNEAPYIIDDDINEFMYNNQ